VKLRFLGAAGQVTGSCYLIEVAGRRLLLECGLIQGGRRDEEQNRAEFPFPATGIDALVVSHAHIDHSGRIPLLTKRGFEGPVYAHRATRDLCRIMLRDAAYLNEKDAQWENRKRERKGLRLLQPLYGRQDAEDCLGQFRGIAYDRKHEILPGVSLRFRDAGHILGSCIVELWLAENGIERKLVFSGDLGHAGAPILNDPRRVEDADIVLLESTYGDRQHRGWNETLAEIGDVLERCRRGRGNILIPAFAVGRTQELLYLFARHYREWGLDEWLIFLDSPLAIQATGVYRKHSQLYDAEARSLWQAPEQQRLLPNLHFTRTSKQSMRINKIRSGAIIIAASGMCTGGRIKHHLKNNVWRKECDVIIVGFQARGTTGRALVDGARHIRLWGETIRVGASVHTIGGLSAHADAAGLTAWYQGFRRRPPVYLVHGEQQSREALAERLQATCGVHAVLPQVGQTIDLAAPPSAG
jgi:metallo-beta-lactamase family protein